jgi:peptidyl-prolyl cis-trans isomerase SurA
LPIGQVSAPFRTPLGIHLMIICERISPRSIPIDRQQIKQSIEQKKLALEAMRQMRNLRRDAYIEIKKD